MSPRLFPRCCCCCKISNGQFGEVWAVWVRQGSRDSAKWIRRRGFWISWILDFGLKHFFDRASRGWMVNFDKCGRKKYFLLLFVVVAVVVVIL